jgi:hypothetical protein
MSKTDHFGRSHWPDVIQLAFLSERSNKNIESDIQKGRSKAKME